MNISRELFVTERPVFLLNLVHDEFIESVIAGHEEVYEEWAAFAAECIFQVLIPEPRDGTVH